MRRDEWASLTVARGLAHAQAQDLDPTLPLFFINYYLLFFINYHSFVLILIFNVEDKIRHF